MPAVIAWLVGALIAAVGTIVGRVLVSLGISLVVYQGVDLAASQFKAAIFAQLGQALGTLGAQGSAIFGVLQIGTAVNIIMSALVARLALRGLSGGKVKRWVTK